MDHKRIIIAKIISNRMIACDHWLMKIESEWLRDNSLPGQFVNITPQENTTDPLLKIPLGVHSVDDGGITLLYRVVGQGTELLASRKVGEEVTVLGPLGNGFDLKIDFDSVFLIAGGCGVSPLYFLAAELVRQNKQVDLFLGAANEKYLVCENEFKQLNIPIHVATDDGSKGYHGYIAECLEEYLNNNNIANSVIYASGPTPMLRAVKQISRDFNISAQLSFEAYMACGIGVCLGCAIATKNGYKLCCKDGPVFNADDIE